MPRPQRVPHRVDDPRKAVYDPMDLVDLGFGRKSIIYQLIKNGKIPSHKIGKSQKVPGAWVHTRMGLRDTG